MTRRHAHVRPSGAARRTRHAHARLVTGALLMLLLSAGAGHAGPLGTALDFECLAPGQFQPGTCNTPTILISGLVISVALETAAHLEIDDSTGSHTLTYDICLSYFPGYWIDIPTDATTISFDVDSSIVADVTVRSYDAAGMLVHETVFANASPGHVTFTSPTPFRTTWIFLANNFGPKGSLDNIAIPGLDLTCTQAQLPEIFADGFESGTTTTWSSSTP